MLSQHETNDDNNLLDILRTYAIGRALRANRGRGSYQPRKQDDAHCENLYQFRVMHVPTTLHA